MKTKRKLGVGRALTWLALALAVLTVLGAVSALIPHPGRSPTFEPYGSEITLVKLQNESIKKGVITAASYANGYHFVSAVYDGMPSMLLVSADGKAWEDLFSDRTIAGEYPYAQVLDEIVYVDNYLYLGFFGWNPYDVVNSATEGYVFRFNPAKDGSMLGGTYGAVFNGSQYNAGRFTCLDVIDGRLHVVDEHGSIYYKTNPGQGAWYPVGSTDFKPFAGYKVTDITKCGSTYLTLGEKDGTSVLFTAKSMSGTWTMHQLEHRAHRVESSGKAAFLACDGGVLAYTTDFVNWSYSKMPDRNVDFTEFFVFCGKHYAIGASDEKGVLYESTNGGASWERVCEMQEPLAAASVSSKEAFLYGNEGGVYRLTIK